MPDIYSKYQGILFRIYSYSQKTSRNTYRKDLQDLMDICNQPFLKRQLQLPDARICFHLPSEEDKDKPGMELPMTTKIEYLVQNKYGLEENTPIILVAYVPVEADHSNPTWQDIKNYFSYFHAYYGIKSVNLFSRPRSDISSVTNTNTENNALHEKDLSNLRFHSR